MVLAGTPGERSVGESAPGHRRRASRRKRWRLLEVIESAQLTDEGRQAAFGAGAAEGEADDDSEVSRAV